MMLTLTVGLLLAQSPEAGLRRFALLVGSNDGGRDRVTLRYANSDARAVSRVLTELGGVDARDVIEVEDPSAEQLSAALDALKGRLEAVRGGKARVEAFFYYSGHSDETGLLLHGERYAYPALRQKLESLPAEVRIAVLDSCASGALNLNKGGAPRPSFLVDASSSLSGHVFVTSSSADEAAQESERLKASIFTHYLLSGLRGAADTSHDGRVTLAEAYQYAFAETLNRTTATRAGPQRPGWDIQLVGTGDLVLTDLRGSAARLIIDPEIGGRVHVMGADGGLVVEVAKTAGKPVELGLEPGEYRVVVIDGAGNVSETNITLNAQSAQTLSAASLHLTPLEETVKRGPELLTQAEMPHLPLDVAFIPPLSISGLMGPPPRVNFALGIIAVKVGAIDGVMLTSVAGWTDGPVKGAAIAGVALKTGAVTGVGLSGVLLVANGSAHGATASIVTIINGDAVGAHASLVGIATGSARGAQLGLFNLAASDVTGTQVGLTNFSGGNLAGTQLGLVNGAWHDDVGAQVGLVNIGGDVRGAQLGLVNIARSVTGTQVGLLNIAQTSTAPVGLLNIITQGTFHVALWGNETSVLNLAVKAGGKYVYGFAVGGLNPRGALGKVNLSYGFGLGGRLRFGRWYGEVEGSAEDLHQVDVPWQSSVLSANARVNVGFQLFQRWAVFVGAQATTLIATGSAQDVKTLSPWGFDLSPRVRLVPGFVLGTQVL